MVPGGAATRLERQRGEPRVGGPRAHDPGGLAERRLEVAVGPPVLVGEVAGGEAASGSVTTGRGAYWTATASAPSRARAGASATTAAIGWPT